MDSRNKAFLRLKPVCVNLSQAVLHFTAKKGNATSVLKAQEALLDVLKPLGTQPDSLDIKLADYVFFPLSHVFRESRALPERGVEYGLKCLTILLKTGWSSEIDPALATQLMILLTFTAGGSPTDAARKISSDEGQLLAYECLYLLLSSSSKSSKGRDALFQTANVPSLGHTVTVILEGIKGGSTMQIQITALDALDAFVAAAKQDPKHVGALKSFFPGTVSSLSQALTPSTSSRRHYRILESGLKILARVITTVMSDAQHSMGQRPSPKLPPEPPVSSSSNNDSPVTSWLDEASQQVKAALAHVLRLQKHQRTEVLSALLDLCLDVLDECSRTLSTCSTMLAETAAAIAANNEGSELEARLDQALQLSSNLSGLLSAGLHGWTVSLPRVIQSGDETVIAPLLNKISMTYTILSNQGSGIPLLEQNMVTSLLESIGIAISPTAQKRGNVPVISEETMSASIVPLGKGGERSLIFPMLNIGQLSQRSIAPQLHSFLMKIAASNDASKMCQQLVSTLPNTTGDMQVGAFWLSLNFLKNIVKRDAGLGQFLVIDDSANENIREELYSFAVSVLTDPDLEDDVSWRLQAIALEAVAFEARQQREDFQLELVEALYPVLHFIGSPVEALRNHALTCLNIIADSCGYASAGELVVQNVDYLVNAVALKLNTFDLSPQAPQVLLMMIRLSGPSLIPYLDDLVGSIFAALDSFHGYTALVSQLFAVLQAMVEEGAKMSQFQNTQSGQKATQSDDAERPTLQSILKLIKSIDRLKSDDEASDIANYPERPWRKVEEVEEDKLVEEEEEGEEELGDDGQVAEVPKSTPPAPKTYNLLLDITRLTQHYLPSSSSSLRSSLLGLLKTSLPALASHEDSLLPLINVLWPVLFNRLDDKEPFITAQTLDVIAVMCSTAGSFMKSRIEVAWPDIRRIIQRTTPHSNTPKVRPSKAPTKSGGAQIHIPGVQSPTPTSITLTLQQKPTRAVSPYLLTTTRMIWKSLVNLLTSVATHVPLSDAIMDEMLDFMAPSFPEDAALKAAFEGWNADAVWLAMVRLRRAGVEGLRGCGEYDLEGLRKPKDGKGWRFADLPAVGG